MILYIDESYDTNYFIVGGLLAKNDYTVKEASKRFRKHAKSFPMKEKDGAGDESVQAIIMSNSKKY